MKMITSTYEILAISEPHFVRYVEAYEALTEKIRAGSVAPSKEEEQSRLLTMYNNIALIEVKGALTNRDSWWNEYFGMISYNEIRQAMIQAIQQGAAATIFDFASPGGAVAGLNENADFLSKMPMKTIAYTSSNMQSAAYFLASQADYLYAGDFSEVGSVGVIVKTYDRSKYLADNGIKPIRFRSGRLKAVGDPDFKLTDEEKNYLQDQVDVFATKFFNIVSDARGMSIDQMDKLGITTGKTFIGEESVKAGLVDKIMSFDQTMLKAMDLAQKYIDKTNKVSLHFR